ncbi:hypothetical protein Dimus_021249 [Dionaea muscipula]
MMSTGETTTSSSSSSSSYWLNWRVLVCATWLFMSMVLSSFLISKYEGSQRDDRQGRESGELEEELEGLGTLYEDQVWRPCLKGMHPLWLLGYRLVSFFVLLILLIVNAIFDGASIFFYYTQWTFTLVTIYFGLGSVLSMYGCYAHRNKVVGDRGEVELVKRMQGGNSKDDLKLNEHHHHHHHLHHHQHRTIAGFWGYAFQIIFQINAGAVLLTDCVFWFVIVPFLATTTRNYDVNFFMVNMHSVNIIFLLGDTVLNSLRFLWFRIAYFFLWTTFYVISQWLLHACISIWWPYPFLDLSASLSPLWYGAVGLMHFPCYGVFMLVIKAKHHLLSRYFLGSYNR